jgi:hypothetical protein
MTGGWVVWHDEHYAVHVVPHGEDHELVAECWCDPDLDGEVWVHHSRDGRELNEANGVSHELHDAEGATV